MLRRRTLLGALGALPVLSLCTRLALAAGPQRIGIIGAGSVGGTLARLWVDAGHEVLLASRHPEALAGLVQRLGSRASAGTPQQAAAFGDVVVIATPYAALPQLGQDLKEVWAGKILLDASNPPLSGRGELAAEAQAQGAGETSVRYLPGTRLVRAFSAVDASLVAVSASRHDGQIGVPIASDDAQALAVAAQLVREAGCIPVVTGDLASARQFQPGNPGFRANTDAASLRRLLGLPADA